LHHQKRQTHRQQKVQHASGLERSQRTEQGRELRQVKITILEYKQEQDIDQDTGARPGSGMGFRGISKLT